MAPPGSLVLASASPRRREIMRRLGLDFEVHPSAFDESRVQGLAPSRHARRAADGKAGDISHQHPGAWVIGCDTVVALDGRALGKPADTADAARMLRQLSGRTHSVVSAMCIHAPDGSAAAGEAISQVRFQALSEPRIQRYVAGGEPVGKAGAYAIQGAAGKFATVTRGRLDTVIGLPGHTLFRLLRESGYPGVHRGLSRPPDGGFASLGRRP
jgi:septum formation protein